jgi:hypothetical protein
VFAGGGRVQANARSFDYENGLASDSVLSAQDDREQKVNDDREETIPTCHPTSLKMTVPDP